MKMLIKLALAALRENRIRLGLTSLATVAAAAMVVWVGSGYDALMESFEDYSEGALGHYQLSVAGISTFSQYAPGDIPRTAMRFVPPGVVDDLRADPDVEAADAMWAQRVRIERLGPPKGPPAGARPGGQRPSSEGAVPGDGRPSDGRPSDGKAGDGKAGDGKASDGKAPSDEKAGPQAAAGEQQPRPRRRPRRTPSLRLLGSDAAQPPFPLAEGRWLDPSTPDALEAAISSGDAERYRLGLGDTVRVGEGASALDVKIVGVVDLPHIEGFTGMVASGQLMTPSVGGLYTSMANAARIIDEPPRISFVAVRVHESADITAFRFRWAPKLNSLETPSQFQEAHDIEETLDQSAAAENVRFQAYMSTAIALLAALFIIFSALSMGVTERTRQLAILRAVALTRGQVAALIAIEAVVLATIGFAGGIGAGQATLWLAASASPELLGDGAVLGPYAITLAAICAYGGALLAALVPMFRATRVRPIDAMAPAAAGRSRAPWLAILIGVMLLPVNLLITYTMSAGDATRVQLAILVGFPAMAVGIVLVAPAVTLFVDRAISPLLARLSGIEPKLLESQLSSNLWRAVGTAAALTVGLSLYVAIQVWGHTMLSSFLPGPWAPDAVVTFYPDGIDAKRAGEIAAIEGIDADNALPIVAEQPRLLEDLTGSAERATVVRQDNVVLIGIDPEAGFGGDDPLFEMEWLQGDRAAAVAAMKAGRGCIVPDHFLRETGLSLGDSFALVPPGKGTDAAVTYTIAAAVRLHGWHWQTKLTGFRSRTHRAAALVFSDYASVAADFAKNKATHFWVDFDEADADKDAIAQAIAAVYTADRGEPVGIDEGKPGQPFLRVIGVDDIRTMVNHHARQWLWAMSRLPLITLIITCLGVLNLILTSVRARRWDMGVMRALGVTRSALVRMVVAEGVLVGVVAVLLSVGLGILAGYCGAGISQYISFFGGLEPQMVVPWGEFWVGLVAALGLSALAAVGPAISVGRAEPLTLLQQGRGTA